MTTTLKTSKERAIREAAAGFQEGVAGMDVTISSGGEDFHVKDPRRIAEGLCAIAEQEDLGTDPWPNNTQGEPEEYVRAENAEIIGAGLIDGIRRLEHLARYRIHYLFRRKDSWLKQGKTVLGEMKRPTGLLKNYAETDFILLINWNAWLAFNPMQRVALVYHELRHGDDEGKISPHDFEGFFDELQLFGTGTYKDWNALARAADVGAGVRHQYTLSLLDQD